MTFPTTCAHRAAPHTQASTPAATPSPDTALARATAQHFLDRFLDADGRAVRRDQGGDTVSEGQGYGMLLAVVASNRVAFDRMWTWTRTHLQRSDRLFSWHWTNGAVADPQPAADADLDIAWALALGAQRFDEPGLLDASRTVAAAILDHETVRAGARTVLVAGEWARSPIVLDPSYLAAGVMRALAGVTGDGRWSSLADDSTSILRALTASSPHLPPDWASVDASGNPHPSGGPQGGEPRYGYDAVRVPLWAAASCTGGDHVIATAMWPFLRRAATGDLAATYTLGGTPVQSPAGAPAYVAAAATAHASGDDHARDALLDRASAAEQRSATYYGSALLALGRALLTTNTLDACPRA